MTGKTEKSDFKLRQYRCEDCKEIAELFYQTVHTINAKDYTTEQLLAWADGKTDTTAWNQSFLSHHTIVAVIDDKIAGFGDMDDKGYLDRLYVHRDYQGMHIASAICDELEKKGMEKCDVKYFITHASITAKPFFENRGYCVIKEQQVERKGMMLRNYVMEKKCG